MARIVVLVLLLALVFAPIAEAAAPSRGESPATGWVGFPEKHLGLALLLAADHPRGVKEKGAVIVPDGLTAAPPVSRSGAVIIPDGLHRPGQLSR